MSRIKVLQLQPDYNVKAHDFADLAEQIVKSLPADRFEVVSAFLIGKPESGEPVSVSERSVYFDFTGKDLKGLRLNALWKLYRFCRDESFDVVICCQSFHHYPNVQDFFNSVYRVLRPGGRLILRDMTAKSEPALWFFNHVELPVVNMAGHGDVHVYGVEEVRELCRKAGLTLESGEKRGFFRLHCVARKLPVL